MKRRIIAARETIRLTPEGEIQPIAVYEYMLDDLGPFIFEIEKEKDTPEALKKAIQEKESLLQAATE